MMNRAEIKAVAKNATPIEVITKAIEIQKARSEAKARKYHSMHEVADDICWIAETTGYDYEFLSDQVEEAVKDGETYEEAVFEVRMISEEEDW